MIVGFTGSRRGMTPKQTAKFREFVVKHEPTGFHHGDCRGADEEAHRIVEELCGDVMCIHPPLKRSYRAYCNARKILASAPYLDRNRDIVDACEWLWATPKEDAEVLRSGTWSTIRYARDTSCEVTIIYPDGNMMTYGKEQTNDK